MIKPLIIGIAGGTGSGKSTLAYALKDKLGGHNRCDVIPLDFYYKDRILLELKDREKLNFDEPEAFDLSLLVNHLKKIKSGNLSLLRAVRLIFKGSPKMLAWMCGMGVYLNYPVHELNHSPQTIVHRKREKKILCYDIFL